MAAFYPWLLCLFDSVAGPLRENGFLVFRLLLRICFEVEKIVHRMPEILFAAEIPFRGLDRCMSEQELNLLKLAPAVMTQFRTRSAEVMRCNVL